MKFLVLFSFLVGCAPAFAQESPYRIYNGIKNAERNYVINPSALHNKNLTSTSSATLTRDTDTADALEGTASFLCDSSTQGGYCAWNMTTPVVGDRTDLCSITFQYKGDATLYQMELLDGSANLLKRSKALKNVADWTWVRVPYACQASVIVRFRQTGGGDGAAVNIGRIKYGSDRDLSWWFVEGYIGGGNPDLGTAALSAYTEITHGSLVMNPKSFSQPVGIMCAGTQTAATPTMATSACGGAGIESMGWAFEPPVDGFYESCTTFAHDAQMDAGVNVSAAFQLIETPVDAQTLTQEGGAKLASRHGANTIATGTNEVHSNGITLCSIFELTAGAAVGIRTMYEQAAVGSAVDQNRILSDESTSIGQRNIYFRVRPVGR